MTKVFLRNSLPYKWCSPSPAAGTASQTQGRCGTPLGFSLARTWWVLIRRIFEITKTIWPCHHGSPLVNVKLTIWSSVEREVLFLNRVPVERIAFLPKYWWFAKILLVIISASGSYMGWKWTSNNKVPLWGANPAREKQRWVWNIQRI